MQADYLKLRNGLVQVTEELKMRREMNKENEKRIDTLVREKHEIESKHDSEVCQLRSQHQKLEKQLLQTHNSFENDIKQMKEQKSLQEYAIEMERKEMQSLRETVRSLQAKNYSLEKQVNEYGSQLQSQMTSRDEFLTQLSGLEKSVATLQATGQRVAGHTDQLQTAVKKATSYNRSLIYINNHQKCLIETERLEVKRLQEALVTAQSLIQSHPRDQKCKLDELMGTVERLNLQVHEKDEKVQALRSEISDIESRRQKSLEVATDANNILARHMLIIEENNAMIADLEKTRDDLKVELEALEKKLESDQESYMKERKNYVDLLAACHIQEEKHQCDLDEKVKEIALRRDENAQYQEEMAQIKKEMDLLKAKLSCDLSTCGTQTMPAVTGSMSTQTPAVGYAGCGSHFSVMEFGNLAVQADIRSVRDKFTQYEIDECGYSGVGGVGDCSVGGGDNRLGDNCQTCVSHEFRHNDVRNDSACMRYGEETDSLLDVDGVDVAGIDDVDDVAAVDDVVGVDGIDVGDCRGGDGGDNMDCARTVQTRPSRVDSNITALCVTDKCRVGCSDGVTSGRCTQLCISGCGDMEIVGDRTKKCGDDHVERIGDDGVGKIGDDGVGKIGDDGVGKIGDDGVGKNGDDHVGKIGDDGVGKNGDDGVGKNGDDGVGKIGDDGVERIGDDGVGKNGDDGVGKIGDDRVERIGDDGVGKNGDDGVGKIGDDGVGKNGDDGVGKIGDDGVGKNGDDGVGKIGDDHVGKIGDDGVGKIGDDGVAKIGDDHVGKIGDDHVGKIGDDHVGKIGDDHVGKIVHDVGKIGDDGVGKIADAEKSNVSNLFVPTGYHSPETCDQMKASMTVISNNNDIKHILASARHGTGENDICNILLAAPTEVVTISSNKVYENVAPVSNIDGGSEVTSHGSNYESHTPHTGDGGSHLLTSGIIHETGLMSHEGMADSNKCRSPVVYDPLDATGNVCAASLVDSHTDWVECRHLVTDMTQQNKRSEVTRDNASVVVDACQLVTGEEASSVCREKTTRDNVCQSADKFDITKRQPCPQSTNVHVHEQLRSLVQMPEEIPFMTLDTPALTGCMEYTLQKQNCQSDMSGSASIEVSIQPDWMTSTEQSVSPRTDPVTRSKKDNESLWTVSTSPSDMTTTTTHRMSSSALDYINSGITIDKRDKSISIQTNIPLGVSKGVNVGLMNTQEQSVLSNLKDRLEHKKHSNDTFVNEAEGKDISLPRTSSVTLSSDDAYDKTVSNDYVAIDDSIATQVPRSDNNDSANTKNPISLIDIDRDKSRSCNSVATANDVAIAKNVVTNSGDAMSIVNVKNIDICDPPQGLVCETIENSTEVDNVVHSLISTEIPNVTLPEMLAISPRDVCIDFATQQRAVGAIPGNGIEMYGCRNISDKKPSVAKIIQNQHTLKSNAGGKGKTREAEIDFHSSPPRKRVMLSPFSQYTERLKSLTTNVIKEHSSDSLHRKFEALLHQEEVRRSNRSSLSPQQNVGTHAIASSETLAALAITKTTDVIAGRFNAMTYSTMSPIGRARDAGTSYTSETDLFSDTEDETDTFQLGSQVTTILDSDQIGP